MITNIDVVEFEGRKVFQLSKEAHVKFDCIRADLDCQSLKFLELKAIRNEQEIGTANDAIDRDRISYSGFRTLTGLFDSINEQRKGQTPDRALPLSIVPAELFEVADTLILSYSSDQNYSAHIENLYVRLKTPSPLEPSIPYDIEVAENLQQRAWAATRKKPLPQVLEMHR